MVVGLLSVFSYLRITQGIEGRLDTRAKYFFCRRHFQILLKVKYATDHSLAIIRKVYICRAVGDFYHCLKAIKVWPLKEFH